MKYYMLTDIGNVRKLNEDYCGAEMLFHKEELSFFAIADGMGGHNKGEVASKLAIENLIYYIKNNLKKKEIINEYELSLLLKDAYAYVNAIVHRMALLEKECSGMGTTLVCVIIYKNLVCVANVGDSRCYLLSDTVLRKITKDNSYIQELIETGIISEKESLTHPQRNVITRAIGTDEKVKVDFYSEKVKIGDKLILCSDGLTNYIEHLEMEKILIENDEKNSCVELVKRSKENNSNDNISVICVSI